MKHIYSYLFLPFLFFLFACSDTEENLIDPYLTVELENNVFNVPIEGKTGTIKIRTNLSDWDWFLKFQVDTIGVKLLLVYRLQIFIY